jgi:hypothetical protein
LSFFFLNLYINSKVILNFYKFNLIKKFEKKKKNERSTALWIFRRFGIQVEYKWPRKSRNLYFSRMYTIKLTKIGVEFEDIRKLYIFRLKWGKSNKRKRENIKFMLNFRSQIINYKIDY